MSTYNSIKPNAAVISLLTYERTPGASQDSQEVLFFHVRPVFSHFDKASPYWYPGAGQRGNAELLCVKEGVRHYFGVGTRDQVSNLVNALLGNQPLPLDNTTRRFRVPAHRPQTLPPDYTNGYTRNQATTFSVLHSQTWIPPTLLQEEVLNALSGWDKHPLVGKHLQPPGFYAKGELNKLLQTQICGMIEHPTPALFFYGAQEGTEGENSTMLFYGFCQFYDPALRPQTIQLKDQNGSLVATADLDAQHRFTLRSASPVRKGYMVSQSVQGIEQHVDFLLIQSISINRGEDQGPQLSDRYNRHYRSREDRRRPTSLQAFTYQTGNFVDLAEGQRVLFYQFLEVLGYLGPDILIADPYFWGTIVSEQVEGTKALDHCQAAFIEALCFAGKRYGAITIHTMGNGSKLREIAEEETDGSRPGAFFQMEQYHRLLEFHQAGNGKNVTALFYNALHRFHNRYWMSIKLQDNRWVVDKCVAVTNSLGNISEVDLIPITAPTQLTVISQRYSALFNTAIRYE